MPVEFEEFKNNRAPRFSPTGRLLGNVPEAKKPDPYPILDFLINIKLAKDQDHAKFILLIIIIITFGLAVFFGIKTYQNFNPEINTAPIDLNQIEPTGGGQ